MKNSTDPVSVLLFGVTRRLFESDIIQNKYDTIIKQKNKLEDNIYLFHYYTNWEIGY